MKIIRIAALTFFAVALAACHSASTPAANEQLIRKSDNPKAWPFTVPEGILRCAGNPKSPGLAAVTFTAQGKTYGLNGGALSGDVFPSADPITLRDSMGLFSGDYGSYIDKGLDLCKKLEGADRPVL